MPDMLVKLYDLPPLMPALVAAARGGAMIRRAVSGDKRKTLAWVRAGFPSWVAETKTAFSLSPVTCFIALREQTIVGFACYDATCPNFFGPTAVAEDQVAAYTSTIDCFDIMVREQNADDLIN